MTKRTSSRLVNRTRLVFLSMVGILMLILAIVPTASAEPDLSDLLTAIRQVESRGNDKAVGDGGKAIGPYQIHKAYWQDAVDFDKSIGGSYNDCFDPVYAEKVVRAYLKRYAPKNATLEQMARIHNGGPKILKRQGTKAWDNTTKYWQKVKKELNG